MTKPMATENSGSSLFEIYSGETFWVLRPFQKVFPGAMFAEALKAARGRCEGVTTASLLKTYKQHLAVFATHS